VYLYFADNRSARRKGAIPPFRHHGRETIGNTIGYRDGKGGEYMKRLIQLYLKR
jgi:hypothetical protein